MNAPPRNRQFRPPPPHQLHYTNVGDNKEVARRWRRLKLHTSTDRLAAVLTTIILVVVVLLIVVGRLGVLVRAFR